MADTCIKCDVAIVGSGFAGALIAHELSQKGISVVILEAGAGITPNINDYMSRFYKAAAKVPESPYPPEFVDSKGDVINPASVAAGRPTALSLLPSRWNKPEQSYLVQKGPAPFPSTYVALAWHIAQAGPGRFPHEYDLRQEPEGLFVTGLAKGHQL